MTSPRATSNGNLFLPGSPRARVAGPLSWLKRINAAAGPFFLPDLSSWEGASPNFAAIAAMPSMVGCIIKSSEGMGPGVQAGAPLDWFLKNWPRVHAAGGDRYGKTWFRGCYHYGWPTPSGSAQADYMLDTVERAGGWSDGDLPPAWDLEGSKWTSRQQVIDVSASFSARVHQRLGRAPILYTGSTWRDFSLKERLGFGSMWSPHMNLASYGWPNDAFALWQFVGDGKYWDLNSTAAKQGWPTSIPGLDAKVDMNVVIDGGVPATSIERVRLVLTGNESSSSSPAAASTDPPPGPGRPRSGGPGGLSTPMAIGIGAALLVAGIALSRVNSTSDSY